MPYPGHDEIKSLVAKAVFATDNAQFDFMITSGDDIVIIELTSQNRPRTVGSMARHRREIEQRIRTTLVNHRLPPDSIRFLFIDGLTSLERSIVEIVRTILGTDSGVLANVHATMSGTLRIEVSAEFGSMANVTKAAIEGLLAEFINQGLASEATVNLIDLKPDPDLPNGITILQTLKVIAPATPLQLLAILGERYPTIDEPWIQRQLDQLRQRGLAIFAERGRYVLSPRGLRSVSVRPGRENSDVARALELGRRRR